MQDPADEAKVRAERHHDLFSILRNAKTGTGDGRAAVEAAQLRAAYAAILESTGPVELTRYAGRKTVMRAVVAFLSSFVRCKFFSFNMVGAGRFERPTPCAQGIGMTSKGSIRVARSLCLQQLGESAFRSEASPRQSRGWILAQFWHSPVDALDALGSLAARSTSE
jgi:hypothetical protein